MIAQMFQVSLMFDSGKFSHQSEVGEPGEGYDGDWHNDKRNGDGEWTSNGSLL